MRKRCDSAKVITARRRNKADGSMKEMRRDHGRNQEGRGDTGGGGVDLGDESERKANAQQKLAEEDKLGASRQAENKTLLERISRLVRGPKAPTRRVIDFLWHFVRVRPWTMKDGYKARMAPDYVEAVFGEGDPLVGAGGWRRGKA